MRSWIAALAGVLLALPLGRAAAADGILDDVELGVLAHDVPIGDAQRESGADGNAELRFASPGFLAPIWAPKPHIGVDVNSAGKNSLAYAGLTWTANFSSLFFGNLGLGGAVHDGPDDSSTPDHKGLGTRVLFHEYVELGARFWAPWSASIFLDHGSNADLGTRNPGLTNLGLRIGYAF
jgi:lipid A 3-O-deacylase